MPIGAVCGRADILSGYGASPDHTPELFGAVGTFNGNPLSMASGVACLSYLKEHQDTFYPTMRAELARMVATVNAHIEANDLNCHMVSSDDRGHVFFQRTEVRSAADVSERQTECARELGLQLNLRGVFVGGGFLYSAQPSPSPTRLGCFCWLAHARTLLLLLLSCSSRCCLLCTDGAMSAQDVDDTATALCESLSALAADGLV